MTWLCKRIEDLLPLKGVMMIRCRRCKHIEVINPADPGSQSLYERDLLYARYNCERCPLPKTAIPIPMIPAREDIIRLVISAYDDQMWQ